MNYIYPHSNPKITTGMMAGYRKQYPKFINSRDNHVKTLAEWRDQSFIGYIKEPEFKVDNFVWWHKLRYRIVEVAKEWIRLSDKMSGDDGFMITKDMYPDNSHYYEGQEESSFKYVREVKIHDMIAIPPRRDIQWQEVEEPELPLNSDGSLNIEWHPHKSAQFQEELKSGAILLEVITKK